GLSVGARAGRTMPEELKIAPGKSPKDSTAAAYSNGPVPVPIENAVTRLQELMWKDAGIVRTGSGLKQAIKELEEIGTQVSRPHSRREFEARNLQIAGLLVARSALAREESRGAHYRTDFPDHNDIKFRKHSIVVGDQIRFE